MMRSLYGKVKAVYGAAKTVGSGDSTTAVFDMQGFQSCMLVFTAGIFALTSTNKVTLTVLESDDATTYGTVAAADMEGMETASVFRAWDLSASDASTVTELHYKGIKRYIKCTLVEGGTVALPMGMAFVGSDQRMKPSVD
jgi:hypothetical protein